MFRFPSLLPRPPLPGEPLFRGEDGEDEEKVVTKDLDSNFRHRLKSEGYDPELIEMGLKVMKNHLRTPEEAFQIGKNYVKEMAK